MKLKVEVLGPAGWSAPEHFRRRERFEIIVISTDIGSVLGPFEVVSPNFEAFEDGNQPLSWVR